ncbi:MAG TPA: carboxypeptidase-like regulatory domain-containing protein, partial [Thermoanaerobaculia bacterium]|nr:carboxypeptidase-like regulatory domain-containing protein [Thermoanaerobaculia bacterium]
EPIGPAAAQTDAQGRYAITEVVAGPYEISVQAPGLATIHKDQPAVVVAQAQVVRNIALPGNPVSSFIGVLAAPTFDIESAVDLTEAAHATNFFRVANVVLAGLSGGNGQTDLFGSQNVAGLAAQLGVSETSQGWTDALKEVDKLKKDVSDLIGVQAVQRLKREAKRQFNLGLENGVEANTRFPILFRRYMEIAMDPLLTMDIQDQDENNKQIDKTKIGQADALLQELKEIVVQLVRSLSRQGQAQTRIDAEAWVPVATRAMTIANKLANERQTGDQDDKNPWAVLSILTGKARDTEVTPYVVLGRHGGRLLELALDIYASLKQQKALTSFENGKIRSVFQDPRNRGNGTPRTFFTDQIRSEAMYVRTYPVPNWG